MAKKDKAEKPESEEKKQPEKPKQPTQEQVRKTVGTNMSFAANLATAMKAIKDAGMSSPQTNNDMKQQIDRMVRQTFGLPPIQQQRPPMTAPQPPPQQYQQPRPQPPQQQKPGVPPRTYPGQKPEER